MKKLLPLLIVLMAMSAFAQTTQQDRVKINGKIIDSDSKPIEYATVIIQSVTDSTQNWGAISDESGEFLIQAPLGEHRILVSFVSYKSHQTPLTVKEPITMESITLEIEATAIGDVVITANAITRRADSFVVNMEGTAMAKGRNAFEALAFAPGVVIRDGLTINGKGVSQVYVNDRLLNLSDTDLEAYLSGISAEDIKSVEVIPIAGAQYDASAIGGILKITLRRQTEGGYFGSVNALSSVSHMGFNEGEASASISYRKNRLNLYSNISYDNFHITELFDEITSFVDNGNKISSNSSSTLIKNYMNAELNVVYELTDNQSLGAVVRYMNSSTNINTKALTLLTEGVSLINSSLNSPENTVNSRLSASLDYNLKIGTKGTTFKANADYTNNFSDSNTDYHTIFDNPTTPDHRYTSSIKGPGAVTNLNFDFAIPLSKIYSIKTGAKLYNMNISNDIIYMNKIGDQWIRDEAQSEVFSYDETVGAVYGEVSATYGKVMTTLGIRGEYSWIDINSDKQGGDLRKNYFNPFPSLTVFYDMNQEKGHSLALNANMKITRPSYSELRPYTIPISEYSYVVGNPELNPTKITNASLTQTIFQKYSLTLDATYSVDPTAQISLPSKTDPNILEYKFVNMDNRLDLTAVLSLPIKVTPWWNSTWTLVGINRADTYTNSLSELVTLRKTSAIVEMQNIFTLPYGLQADLDGLYLSRMIQGNFEVDPFYSLNVGVTKSLFKERLSVKLSYTGVLQSRHVVVTINDPTYYKRNAATRSDRYLELSLRFNFNGGKKVNIRKADSGSSSESGRL